jgi:hypothetical protein
VKHLLRGLLSAPDLTLIIGLAFERVLLQGFHIVDEELSSCSGMLIGLKLSEGCELTTRKIPGFARNDR